MGWINFSFLFSFLREVAGAGKGMESVLDKYFFSFFFSWEGSWGWKRNGECVG